MTQALKKRNILGEIMNEINGFDSSNRPMDSDKNDIDLFFGNSGPCILEEY